MGTAKDILVEPIESSLARKVVRQLHYSGKVDPRSQLHFGVFLDGKIEGAMQLGPPLQKTSLIDVVPGTAWNGFCELNRMAFSDRLPRNSESRALGFMMRYLRREAPHIEWVVSFSDATQCGDGAIYRASGFILSDIKPNRTMWRLPSGEVIADVVTRMKGSTALRERIGFRLGEPWSEFARRVGAVLLDGHQLRYIRLLSPRAEAAYVGSRLPFSDIDTRGASMYKGKVRAGSGESIEHPSAERQIDTDPSAPLAHQMHLLGGPSLPSRDRATVRQMTFTLPHEDAAAVDAAVRLAVANGAKKTTALAEICRAYIRT